MRTASQTASDQESTLPDYRQQQGQICETILTEWLLRQGYYVCRPLAAQGPVDCVAYNDDGQILLLDAKQENRRVNPGRKIATRVHRPLTALQKSLGVRVAYIDLSTRDVHVVPPIDET